MPRFDLAAGLAGLALITGLGFLFSGLGDATPVAFFGTPEEHRAIEEGRGRLLVAASLLAAAGGLFAVRGKTWTALLVALPGVVCPGLAFGLPQTLFAWLAFVTLAPAALIAAVAVWRPRRAR